jgi:hypothetical protein
MAGMRRSGVVDLSAIIAPWMRALFRLFVLVLHFAASGPLHGPVWTIKMLVLPFLRVCDEPRNIPPSPFSSFSRTRMSRKPCGKRMDGTDGKRKGKTEISVFTTACNSALPNSCTLQKKKKLKGGNGNLRCFYGKVGLIHYSRCITQDSYITNLITSVGGNDYFVIIIYFF